MVWICPICELGLEKNPKGWSCDNQHSFDQAKEGYVNLLPAHQKRSKNPGDNLEMVLGRRAIHEAHLYQPLAEALANAVADRERISTLLDIGSGEGYYGGLIARSVPEITVYGIDISKSAVKLAAKKYRNHNFAVAGARHLPVATSSIDLALCIFSPSTDHEVARVLKNGGHYLEVGPAPRHLWQLKKALYDQPREHNELRRSIEGSTLAQDGEVCYDKQLNNAQLQALVAATPLAFGGHREKKAELLEQTTFSVTMAFSWRLFTLSK